MLDCFVLLGSVFGCLLLASFVLSNEAGVAGFLDTPDC